MTTADEIVFALIWAGAIPATLFVALYPFLSPGWRRTWIGWALLTSSSALALLLDLSLATKLFGTEFLARDAARITVTALVALGANLKLTALLVTKAHVVLAKRRRTRERITVSPDAPHLAADSSAPDGIRWVQPNDNDT